MNNFNKHNLEALPMGELSGLQRDWEGENGTEHHKPILTKSDKYIIIPYEQGKQKR